jgi:hypothetical protein
MEYFCSYFTIAELHKSDIRIRSDPSIDGYFSIHFTNIDSQLGTAPALLPKSPPELSPPAPLSGPGVG